MLAFTLASAPERIWSDLETLIPPMSARDSAFFARARVTLPRGARQVQLPLTIRLDDRGGVRADTTLILPNGRAMHVTLERMDTISVKRAF